MPERRGAVSRPVLNAIYGEVFRLNTVNFELDLLNLHPHKSSMITLPDGSRLLSHEVSDCLYEFSPPAAVQMDPGAAAPAPEATLILYYSNGRDRTFKGEEATELVAKLRKAKVPINLPTRGQLKAILEAAGFQEVAWISEVQIRASGPKNRIKAIIEQSGANAAKVSSEGYDHVADVFRSMAIRMPLRE